MISFANVLRTAGLRPLVTLMSLLFVIAALLPAQPKYRTFDQNDLALKKAKAGKALASQVHFKFKNTSGFTVTSLHAKLNSEVTSIQDSGGYTTLTLDSKGKTLDATGRTVVNGDSVTLGFIVEKKAPGTQVKSWAWDISGVSLSSNGALTASPDLQIQTQPNGGNIRDFLYKHVIERPNGLLVGIFTNTPNVGWIRFMKSDRNYFPHTDSARCFDSLKTGMGGEKAFVGEHKNLHLDKHNNHLLGEVHALILAIIANDSGVTQPDTPAVRLGNLIYYDSSNGGDPCNGLTLRGITHLVDSALTYCSHFVASYYKKLDTCVSRINRGFDGPDIAVSFSPFVLAGTHTLAEVHFLHTNPVAQPFAFHRVNSSIIDQTPEQFALSQNYPNPFNPTTIIEFNLVGPGVVTLKVYNVLGQEVATLLNQEAMDEGEQSIEFSANNLPSGVYFYRISVQGTGDLKQQYQSIKRMMLIK